MIVKGKNGSLLRYSPNAQRIGATISRDEDKQILVDFDDEEAYTWFMLRWT